LLCLIVSFFRRLSGNNLTGTVTSEIGKLTALTYLYLHNNDLNGTIPSAVGNLNKLQYL
jgi:Leucine-rich repeat (LRR) protein